MRLRKRLVSAAVVMTAMVSAGPPAASLKRQDLSARNLIQPTLDLHATRYLANPCRVGISIAAWVGGRSWFANDGVVERGRPNPPTPESVYELASVTKTFVGALAAAALVNHRVTLDGDFRAHLASSYPNLARAGRPITLRSLATHTSGLPRDMPDSDAILATPDYDAIASQFAALNSEYTRAGDLTNLHGVALRSTPGLTFAYSNLGMRVLGYGLEGIYRQSLEELLRRRILRPLGMRTTGFAVALGDRPRLVTPYNRDGKAQPLHDASAGAGYGLYSTPRDMARYLQWQLDLRDPAVRRSHQIIRGTSRDGEALIWNVTVQDGERMFWHGGGSFGATSQVVLFPEAREGFVFLANDACAGSETELKDMAIRFRREFRLARPQSS